MIVFFGGFLGSGRKSIARRYAARYGFHYYDIDNERLHRFVRDKKGRTKERPVAARGDKALMQLYEKVAARLPLLVKMHQGVVIDHAFHRDAPRKYLFAEARKLSNDVALVWIQSEEQYVLKRLQLLEKRKMIRSVADALRGRALTKKYFQLFRPAPAVFKRAGYRREELAELRTLIQKQVSQESIGDKEVLKS
ncbi:hypothetical protein K8R03_01690 [Candidatus Kaiserbacteria bacterium]|nr:hypothetical protein [Candidatus Kaiserbacteria bacterium]